MTQTDIGNDLRVSSCCCRSEAKVNDSVATFEIAASSVVNGRSAIVHRISSSRQDGMAASAYQPHRVRHCATARREPHVTLSGLEGELSERYLPRTIHLGVLLAAKGCAPKSAVRP